MLALYLAHSMPILLALYGEMDVWRVVEGQKVQFCTVFWVRRGRLRWFGHSESKGVDDWVSISKDVVVAGVRCVGRKNRGRVCER